MSIIGSLYRLIEKTRQLLNTRESNKFKAYVENKVLRPTVNFRKEVLYVKRGSAHYVVENNYFLRQIHLFYRQRIINKII